MVLRVGGVRGWGGGAGERSTRTSDPAAPSPSPKGRQWAAWFQDTFGVIEALLKYVHCYGMFVYCTRMLWHSKNSIKSLLNQFLCPIVLILYSSH